MRYILVWVSCFGLPMGCTFSDINTLLFEIPCISTIRFLSVLINYTFSLLLFGQPKYCNKMGFSSSLCYWVI